MQENTNKAIAINSLILYVRLVVISISGLLYTRFSLEALGVNDYGLYSVIACIITFISVLNTIMVTTSNRFIAIAIGLHDKQEICNQFNINLLIHIAIALLTVVLATPIGHWYIQNFVSYNGNMSVAKVVYDVSIISAALSFVGVPYNGLLMARERFLVFCSTDVLMSLFKLFFTYLLISHFENKLIVYSWMMAFMAAFPTFVFWLYCRKAFANTTRFVFVRKWKKYNEVLKFSASIGIGAIAMIGKVQGGALIINMFFTTAMNAGLAVANSVNTILMTFANNAQKPISPQIVKSFAVGDMERCTNLVCLASKATYLSMFFVSIPFLISPELIFGLWLKSIPPYAVTFTRLLIIDNLIFSINAGVNDFVNATGKIKLYQIVINSLIASAVIVGYIAIRCGMPPEYLFYVYITFSFIVFVVRPFILKHISQFNVSHLIHSSYMPVLTITFAFLLVFIIKPYISQLQCCLIAYVFWGILVYVFAFNKMERRWLNQKVLTICQKLAGRKTKS